MIRLHQLTFGYDRRHLLFENLTMNLHPGHIYGLLGKNGAGKSSLLRNMAGLLFPLSGHVEVNGHVPAKRLPAFLQDLYFIPEEIFLPPVAIDRYLDIMAPFYPGFDEQQFRGYIREMDIPEQNKLNGMSYGQRKKVMIAFSLATNCRVLLMDEPTNGLDIPSKSQFRKIVSSALESDRIILISTHQVRDLDNLIDGIIILENSEILVHHSLESVSERLYFGTIPDIDSNPYVLYSAPSLYGYKAVSENLDRQESRVDLEHLFHAAIENPLRIKQLFQP